MGDHSLTAVHEAGHAETEDEPTDEPQESAP